MRLFPQHDPQPETFIVVLDDQPEPAASVSIPYHCGWCEPYIDGATTGICADCKAKYFPTKQQGGRS